MLSDLISRKGLLRKAVDKQSRFNSVLISDQHCIYKLLFGSHARVQQVKTIPGSDEPSTLIQYKEDIVKPYSKISFFMLFIRLLRTCNNSSSSDEDEQPIISPEP